MIKGDTNPVMFGMLQMLRYVKVWISNAPGNEYEKYKYLSWIFTFGSITIKI